MSTDVDVDIHQLAGEILELRRLQVLLPFTAKPFEVYTLVAALQGASRNPALSDGQRAVVLGFAHQLADQLCAAASENCGPESLIVRTIVMGFDPAFDIQRDDKGDDLPDYLPDDYYGRDEPIESHVLGERTCRYVEPTWIRTIGDDELDLCKCARCSRFFVQSVPIRLFLGEGIDTLGLEVCETCAPTVVGRMVH